MKILSIYAKSFGKLKDFKLDFSDGLTVLAEDNGFGKTTLAAFIKAMFFGINYSTKRSVEENEYKRYKPFNSTEKFGGSLRFFHDGKIYRIERFFGATLKEQEARIFDEQTNKPFKLDTSDPSREVGCRLLGLDADAFMRSLYFPQDAIVVESNDSFVQKLSNLAENADDDTNAKKADERLREFCKKLKYEKGNGGIIFELNQKKEQTHRQLEKDKINWRRQKALSEEIIALTEQLAQNDIAMTSAQKTFESAQQEIKKYEKTSLVLSLQEQIRENEQKQADIKQKQQSLAKQPIYQNTDDAACSTKIPLWQTVLCILAAICGVGLCFWKIAVGLVVLFAAVVAFAVFFVINKTKAAKTANLKQSEINAALAQQQNALASFSAQLSALSEAVNDLKIRLKQAAPEGAEKIAFESKQAEQKLAAAQKTTYDLHEQKLTLTRRLAEDKKELDILLQSPCNPVETEGQILRLTEQIAEAEYKYTAAKLARDVLNLSREKLTESYLPRLNDLFNNYLRLISDGRIGEATVNARFSVCTEDGGQQRDAAYLSKGCKDVCNFALRLALVECIYGNQLPFVILDDPFVNFDKNNCAKAMQILADLAKSTQIILLTCHTKFAQPQKAVL